MYTRMQAYAIDLTVRPVHNIQNMYNVVRPKIFLQLIASFRTSQWNRFRLFYLFKESRMRRLSSPAFAINCELVGRSGRLQHSKPVTCCVCVGSALDERHAGKRTPRMYIKAAKTAIKAGHCFAAHLDITSYFASFYCEALASELPLEKRW